MADSDVPTIVVPKLISRNRTVEDDAKHAAAQARKKGSLTADGASKSPLGSGQYNARSSSSSPAGSTPPMGASLSPAGAHGSRDSAGMIVPLTLNSGEPVSASGNGGVPGALVVTDVNGGSNGNNGFGSAAVPTSPTHNAITGATELHPDQPVMDIAEGPIFTESELDMGRKWKFTLSFPVPALEQYYLLFYRARALFLARIAFAVVLIVNTIAAYTDTFVYDSDDLPTIYAIRYAGIEPLCLGMGLFTLNPRWEPYRQRVTAFWVLSVGALLISISYVSGTPDHGVYMVYFFAVYLFVGLRFLYTAGMCWLLFIMFNIVNYICTYDRLGERRTWVESFGYLFLTNLMLMVTGYILESSSRSAFLKLQKLRLEQTRTNKILRNILPEEMVENLLEGKLTADYYQLASVLFCDIYDFKAISSDLPAHELVGMMNHIFSRFDAIMDRYQAIKIETIGEVYMAASGLPQVADWHAENLCYLALEMQQALAGFRAPPVRARAKSGQQEPAAALPAPDDVKVPHGASDDAKDKFLGKRIQLRIGINSGKTIAGVIGLKLPRYRLFGDTVNTASRMQSTCLPEKIQISEVVYDQVRECMRCTYRGTIPVKGKGEMKTWFIDGAAHPQDPAHNVNINVKTQGASANMFSELMRAGEARARDIYDDDPEEAALVADAARRESLILSAAASAAVVYPASAPASSSSPLAGAAAGFGAALASGLVAAASTPGGHHHHPPADGMVAAAAGAWARRPEDGGQLIKRRNSQRNVNPNGMSGDYSMAAFGVSESPRARGASKAVPTSTGTAVTASALSRGQSFAGPRTGGGGARMSVTSASGPGRFHAHMRSASVSRMPPELLASQSVSTRALQAIDEKKGHSSGSAATPAAADTAPVAPPSPAPAPAAALAATPGTPAYNPSQALISDDIGAGSSRPAVSATPHDAIVIELPTLNSGAAVVSAPAVARVQPSHPPTRSEPDDKSEA